MFALHEPLTRRDLIRLGGLVLASQAPRPVNIVYTGLRPGEKCHEVLLGADEVDDRPKHPLISHVSVPPLPIGLLDRVATPDLDDVEITEELRSLVSRRVEALEH